jgi:hypothetical protein
MAIVFEHFHFYDYVLKTKIYFDRFLKCSKLFCCPKDIFTSVMRITIMYQFTPSIHMSIKSTFEPVYFSEKTCTFLRFAFIKRQHTYYTNYNSNDDPSWSTECAICVTELV